ncbi:HAD-IIA family hydrolase [Cohaesibacter marisflavi]|uniref:HAD-IIA family hydrolase n=1 Tax=Cohaesibacter marisflavi TaxID=655353 RepID=UPI0029C7D357|nr:HAD hydrolase-like protein [Cohaesibacter marisflavi]
MLPTLTSEQAFERYEAVRHRFPNLSRNKLVIEPIKDLSEIVDRFDAFVFDAFGVLNVGETPIKGARERIEALRAADKHVFVLTNAASYCFNQVVAKFKRLGFDFRDCELVSSRAVCEMHLPSVPPSFVWGVAAPSSFQSEELSVKARPLLDDPDVYDEVDGFLILSSESWTLERQALLFESLIHNNRPVIVANPDIVAPREEDMSVEPGYYAHNLLDRLPDLSVTFHGKPFGSVYDEIEARLGSSIPRHRISMMGDSLHTDILGARVRGWGSVLVTVHGFLRGQNPMDAIHKSGIYPDFMTPSI